MRQGTKNGLKRRRARSICSGLCFHGSLRVLRSGPFVKGGIGKIDVLGVHLVLAQPQTLAEALEVDDLTLPEEADDVVHVGVVGQPENVVIGLSGLLFCCDLVRTTCCFSSRDTF